MVPRDDWRVVPQQLFIIHFLFLFHDGRILAVFMKAFAHCKCDRGRLGAVLNQLPPSFSVSKFRQTEAFLENIPSGYEYALEFRHPSWETEGPWETLEHYHRCAILQVFCIFSSL